jgi:DNA repair protein RecO (recombination protein O)
MAIRETEAVVLRSILKGETSKILSFFTKGSGKVKCIAKGARQIKSRYGATLEPMSIIYLQYYYKHTRDIQIVSKTEFIQPLLNLREDLERTAAGLVIMETVEKTTVPEDECPQTYKLLVEVLSALDAEKVEYKSALWYFLVHYMDFLGFRPNFQKCTECGGNLLKPFIRQSTMDFLCHRCAERTVAVSPLAPELLQFLFHIQNSSINNIHLNSLHSFFGEIDSLLWNYARFHVDGLEKLKSIRVLGQIT